MWDSGVSSGRQLLTGGAILTHVECGAVAATYRSRGGFSMLARLSSPLAVHRGALVAGRPGRYRLLVLPEGCFHWDGEVLTYGDAEYHLGDHLSLGGGEVELRGLTSLVLPPGWGTEGRGFLVSPPRQHQAT